MQKMRYLATVDNNLGLANALSYHASHRVYDLWITLLFHLFFGATILETESRNRVLLCSLLIGDAMFVFLIPHYFVFRICFGINACCDFKLAPII